MLEPQKSLWELMEMEAVERYFIDRESARAELPAIIISTGIFSRPGLGRSTAYTVWFGRGISNWTFNSLRKARKKVEEILGAAKVPIEVRIEGRGRAR